MKELTSRLLFVLFAFFVFVLSFTNNEFFECVAYLQIFWVECEICQKSRLLPDCGVIFPYTYHIIMVKHLQSSPSSTTIPF